MLTENVEALFELSPMQQGMLFHSLYALQSGIYVEQIMCRLTGLLDVPAFERAWEMVVAQHQILRTSFFWTDLERPMQVVHREAPLPFIQHDWRGIAANEQQARLETLIHADRKQGFEFSEPPLMRLILVRLAESSYQLSGADITFCSTVGRNRSCSKRSATLIRRWPAAKKFRLKQAGLLPTTSTGCSSRINPKRKLSGAKL